jgi:hypothetical protein
MQSERKQRQNKYILGKEWPGSAAGVNDIFQKGGMALELEYTRRYLHMNKESMFRISYNSMHGKLASLKLQCIVLVTKTINLSLTDRHVELIRVGAGPLPALPQLSLTGPAQETTSS